MNPFDIVDYDSTLEHLRLDRDVTEQKNVEICALGALRYCLNYCERPDFSKVEDLPNDFVYAYLLVLDDFWHKRRDENLAVKNLLSPLRNLRDMPHA